MSNDESISTPTDVPPEILWKYRHFQRVLMSYVDFQQAADIADIILSQMLHDTYPRENRILLEALNCAMVVAYCRPFSGHPARGGSAAPDLPDRYLRLLSPDEKHVHDVIMEDRNRVLAHSDS